MAERERYDVVIVGASIAGCTAAIFLGRRGLKVLVVERASREDAYKKVCTHFIQPCGTATLERLGIVERMEAAGAVRNSARVYTPFGKIEHLIDEHGYSFRREKLDPLLREVARGTDGVEIRFGVTAKSLVRDGDRVTGVTLGDGTEIGASLVVGADGRHSKVAEWAGLEGKESPNNRFFYFSYFESLPLVTGQCAQIWFLDPDVAYCFPNDDGLTVAAVMPHKDHLPAFKSDIEKSFLSFFAKLPDAPDFASAKRHGEFLGMIEMPNRIRPASAPGLALVGDAAMTSDPIMGVGCGWALQSAEWLSEDVADALLTRSASAIDAALATYRVHHDARLKMHHDLINGLSAAKPFNVFERFLFRASARDEGIARDFEKLNARLRHPKEVMGPRFLARAMWAHRPTWLGRKEPSPS